METTRDSIGNETGATEIAWQRFSIPYDYPVAFTRGLFQLSNGLFADMLARREPDKRHRAMIYVDDGVLKLGATSQVAQDRIHGPGAEPAEHNPGRARGGK